MFDSLGKNFKYKIVQTAKLINECFDSEVLWMLKKYPVMGYILRGTISKESPAFKDWFSKLHEEEKNRIMACLDRLGI